MWWNRATSACASPTRASTAMPVSSWRWPPSIASISTTSASTSSRPAPWACVPSRWATPIAPSPSLRRWSAFRSRTDVAMKRFAGKRQERPITARYLQAAAMFYLERYPTTAAGLHRVLQRRVAKAKMADAPVMENVDQAIDAIVANFVAAGVIDDKAFAQTKARALHRRGTSTLMTRRKLKLAGID